MQRIKLVIWIVGFYVSSQKMSVRHVNVCLELSSQLTNKYLWKLWLSLKHGALNMTPKANDKIFSGNTWYPYEPRKLTCRNHKRRHCSSFIIFFDIKGSVHFEFTPQGQTFNQDYFVEILKRLHEPVHRKRSERSPTIGFSTITMLLLTSSLSSSLWPKNRLLKLNPHRTHLIWLWMSPGCFQKQNLL